MKSLKVPIADVFPDPNQPRKRFVAERLNEMAASLREVGLLQPLRVRRENGRLVIEDGECRYQAARLAGLELLDVVLEERAGTPADILQRQLIANCQRDDLSPLEMARSIDTVMQTCGWTAAQVAEKLRFSEATVSRLLALRTIPADLQELVESGAIGTSVALELARIPDAAERRRLAEEIASGRLTRDALTGRRKRGVSAAAASAEKSPRIVAELGQGRTIAVRGPALDLERCIAWLEELLSKFRRVRAQNLELATFARMLRDQARAESADAPEGPVSSC